MHRIMLGGILLVALAVLGGARPAEQVAAFGDGPAPTVAEASRLLSPTTCGWNVVPAPGGSIMNALAVVGPNDVWAIGSSVYHWNGSQWSAVTTPQGGLSDIAALAPDNVWAVGAYVVSGILRTFIIHWDGVIWSVVPSPNAGPGHNGLGAVAGTGPNDIWAAGTYQNGGVERTLLLHWDGTVWSVVPSPNAGPGNHYLQALAARAPNDVWVVGYFRTPPGQSNEPTNLVLHWDGVQWRIVPSPNPGGGSILRSVTAISADAVWAVGVHILAIYDVVPMTLYWNGSVWSVVSNPPIVPISELYGVTAVGPDDVWAVGRYSVAGEFRGLLEHWDGHAWSMMPGPSPDLAFVRLDSVAAGPAGELWAVGGGWLSAMSLRYGGACPGPSPILTPTRTPTPWPTRTATPTRTGTPPTALPTATMCSLQFADVPPDEFYLPIRCLACRAIVEGYTCGGVGEPCNPTNDPYFRPAANLTRGQLCKMVALAAGFTDPIPSTQQTFTDVPNTAPFWLWIEQLAGRGVINGYACGGVWGGGCDPQNRPYFLPGNSLTRGQLMKIVANSTGFQHPVPPTQQTFADVPVTHPFWVYIERLADYGIVRGYPCGGPGEPCDPVGRAYLRVNNLPTRAQTAKIVAMTFLPNCQTPQRAMSNER